MLRFSLRRLRASEGPPERGEGVDKRGANLSRERETLLIFESFFFRSSKAKGGERRRGVLEERASIPPSTTTNEKQMNSRPVLFSRLRSSFRNAEGAQQPITHRVARAAAMIACEVGAGRGEKEE